MANPSMDRDGVAWLRQQLQEAHPDLLREMLATMVGELMGAEAQALCGAEFGERSSERTNSRNGYREREWDTRAGTLPVAIPKLRQGVVDTFRTLSSPPQSAGHDISGRS